MRNRESADSGVSLSKRPFGNRLRTLVVATLASGSLLFAAAPAAAQSKIAVVDVRRAVLETEQGLRVQATLKKLFDNRQLDLDSKQRQLQQDKETLDKDAQGGKQSKEVLQKKYETLQRQANELQTTMVESQREMQRKEGELTTPILQGVLDVVKRIAAQDGFEMVLEKSAVPYFRGDLEVTDRVIQMFNSGQPGGKSTAPATPGKPAAAPAKPAPAPKK